MSYKTKAMLKHLKEILCIPRVEEWHGKHLESLNQSNTLSELEKGVVSKNLSVHEALAIAFLVGFQWNENFEASKKG